MQDLAINTQPVYYKLLLGSQQIFDSYGDFTGSYEEWYGDVVSTTACVSGTAGNAAMREYGKSDGFDIIVRTSVASKFAGVTTKSVFWIGFGNIEEFGEQDSYAAGDYAIYDGSIYRCIENASPNWDSSQWVLVPYNYIVTDPRFVCNSAAIYLHKVNVNES